MKLHGNTRDLSGQRFGRLIAVCVNGRVHGHGMLWKCLCDCGKSKVIRSQSLVGGATRSCGCLHSETARATGRKGVTHGRSKTQTYHVWAAMIRRCENPSSENYRYYGGRGIKVSESWRRFENFFADMGERPQGLSLERLDNNAGYFKGNCAWATQAEQNINKRPALCIHCGKTPWA